MEFFGLFGGKKKGRGGIQTYQPPPYGGPRPYEAGAVGYGAPELKTLAGAYLPELQRRAMGQGLVGFDPAYRQTLKSEFLKDFGDYESDIYAKAGAQASGQGLRGGIPLSIRQEYAKGLGRARESGLADIDIRDLEARRQDINRAFYQQPEEITRGAGIQRGAADFGLAEYEQTKPQPFIRQPDYSGLGELFDYGISSLGDFGGLLGGGEDTGRIPFPGEGGSGKLGKAFFGQTGVGGNVGYNKSFYKDPRFYTDMAKLAAMFL